MTRFANVVLIMLAGVLTGRSGCAQQPAFPGWSPWRQIGTMHVADSGGAWVLVNSIEPPTVQNWRISTQIEALIDGPGCPGTPAGQGWADFYAEYCVPAAELSNPALPSRIRIGIFHLAGSHPVRWRYVSALSVSGGTFPPCFSPPAGPEWGRDGRNTFCPTFNLIGESVFEFGPTPAALQQERVDANTPAFRDGFFVTGNPQRLCIGGQARHGVAADGVSRLVVRVPVPGPGDVSSALLRGNTPSPANGDDGRLFPLGSSSGVISFSGRAFQTSAGWMGLAVYRAPADFAPANGPVISQFTMERYVNIKAEWTPLNCLSPLAQRSGTQNLSIHRVPVILSHGLWADAATWGPAFVWPPAYNPFPGAFLQNAFKYDYQATAASSFRVNAIGIHEQVQQAAGALRSIGIACTQVDWVGHSMGGLLPRVYFRRGLTGAEHGGGFYYRPDNFGDGDFHKLITINTPHWGSPWADILKALGDVPALGPVVAAYLADVGLPFNYGAIEDLQEGSAALASLGETQIPAHAIVSVSGPAILGNASQTFQVASTMPGVPPKIRVLFKLLAFLTSTETTNLVYRGEAHDLVVLEASQRGGLPPAATTVYSQWDTNHLKVTHHPGVASRVFDLLQARLDSGLFAAFIPAPNLTPSSAPAWPPPGWTPPIILGGGITIGTPASGSNVTAGQSVSFPITISPGVTPLETVILFGEAPPVSFSGVPAQATISIPGGRVGSVPVRAVSRTASGSLVTSVPAAVNVASPGPLAFVGAEPSEIRIVHPSQPAGIRLVGYESTTAAHVATTAAAWATSNPAVVTVLPDGRLVTNGQGSASVTATLGGQTILVPVTVQYTPVLPYVGTSGSGWSPALALDTDAQVPRLGNAGFRIRVNGMPGPLPGFLGIASRGDQIPIAGQTIVIPWMDALYVPFAPPLGTPVGGYAAVLSAPLPNDPSLSGAMFFVQAVIADAAAPGGLRLTNGLRLTLIP